MKACSYCFSKINYENEDYSQQPFLLGLQSKKVTTMKESKKKWVRCRYYSKWYSRNQRHWNIMSHERKSSKQNVASSLSAHSNFS